MVYINDEYYLQWASVVWCAGVVLAHDSCFPEGFLFGASTAAYQVEGAWDADGRSPSVWDEFSHRSPSPIADGSTGDVACDSYNMWKTDIQIARDMNLDFYRFSISWSRLLPTGFPNSLNREAVRYYNDLIDGLLDQGIRPFVTLQHFDLPQKLQDLGGWSNPLISDWFAEYARVVFELFADRVPYWITINEPLVVCSLGYGHTLMAPGTNNIHVAYPLCEKNMMLAHAKAYRLYQRDFQTKYKGRISISNHLFWLEPSSDHPRDRELSDLATDIISGRYTHPIFSSEGGWPLISERYFDKWRSDRGITDVIAKSFALTKEEREFIRGTYDFFAVNHYTSRLVRRRIEGDDLGLFPLDGGEVIDAKFIPSDNWPKAATFWSYIYPKGIRKTLNWIKERFNNPEIIITENGYSTNGYGLDDYERIKYHKDHLEQVSLAMKEDGVRVVGYTAWSLIDNYEWMDGYTKKFGLYEVDFRSPNLTRTPRLSAKFYRKVIDDRCITTTTTTYDRSEL